MAEDEIRMGLLKATREGEETLHVTPTARRGDTEPSEPVDRSAVVIMSAYGHQLDINALWICATE
jgi:hypothetical protein